MAFTSAKTRFSETLKHLHPDNQQVSRGERDLLSLTWQAVADQLLVLLHRGQHFGASTVDGSFGLHMFVKGLENTGGHVRTSQHQSRVSSARPTPYCFVLITADVVRVRHKQEAVPPLLVLLHVLKDGSREDGLVLQRNLQKSQPTFRKTCQTLCEPSCF